MGQLYFTLMIPRLHCLHCNVAASVVHPVLEQDHESCLTQTRADHLLTRPIFLKKKRKGKDIPVTGHEGPQGCETWRLTHLL
jgi:hypothetical protein